jgi:hypothetical protein
MVLQIVHLSFLTCKNISLRCKPRNEFVCSKSTYF